MSTQAVGTYKLNSFWEAGRLIFYEKAYGHTTTGDVFILGHDYVQVGDTANDVDFQWYGTGSKSFVLDLSGATATSAGLAWTITGDLAVTGAITLTGDVSLTGDLTLATEDVSVTQGHMIYLDGQDGGEYLTSDAANYAMLNGTTGVNIAVGGSDKISVIAATTTVNNDVVMTAGEFISGAPVKQLITDKTGGQTLTTAESGLIRVTTDDVYIYLPTYLGNTGLTYTIKACATHSAGVHIRGNTSQLIDANSIQTSGAQYNFITIIATLANGWNVIAKDGTWTGTA